MKAMAGVGMSPSEPTVATLADGRTRCSWATSTGMDLVAYHDDEWGTPTYDPLQLFEALCLTYFENGLSWATVFRKRDAFRRAFHDFDPTAVAAMTGRDIGRLLADRSIVRHRGKIEATIHNARLVADGSSLATLVWAHAPRVQPVLVNWSDGRMSSPESRQLSDTLKHLGYHYVGPVVAHSFMQTVGMENGHFAGCFRAHRTDATGDSVHISRS